MRTVGLLIAATAFYVVYRVARRLAPPAGFDPARDQLLGSAAVLARQERDVRGRW